MQLNVVYQPWRNNFTDTRNKKIGQAKLKVIINILQKLNIPIKFLALDSYPVYYIIIPNNQEFKNANH